MTMTRQRAQEARRLASGFDSNLKDALDMLEQAMGVLETMAYWAEKRGVIRDEAARARALLATWEDKEKGIQEKPE